MIGSKFLPAVGVLVLSMIPFVLLVERFNSRVGIAEFSEPVRTHGGGFVRQSRCGKGKKEDEQSSAHGKHVT